MPRYIDADALIEFIDLGHLRNPLELSFSERDVVDMIESRPTADVRPNVRGKWIISRDNDQFYCSVCGELSDYKYRFCPDCGADMRQGDTE